MSINTSKKRSLRDKIAIPLYQQKNYINSESSMNSRQKKTWKWLAIGGLFATAGYFAQRMLPSTSSAPSNTAGFLANCNATLWHYEAVTNFTLQDIYKDKIVEFVMPGEEHDLQLKDKLKQLKLKLAKKLDALRSNSLLCNKKCDYINLVLDHPDFNIFICKDLRMEAIGLYRPDMHAILFDISVLNVNESDLEKLMLHEFWHAYKTLVHTSNENPANPNSPKITPETNPGTAYLRNATDAAIRKREFIIALMKGDARILKELPLLLEKEKLENLSFAEIEKLVRYKEAITDYSAELYAIVIDSSIWKNIASQVKNALKNGGTYQYIHQIGKNKFLLYVQAFKELNHEIVFEGYSTPSKSDKMTAIINDAKYRIFFTPHSININPHNPTKDKNLQILTERDAHIAGLGEKIKYLFYPELMQFHHCEHNEVSQLRIL